MDRVRQIFQTHPAPASDAGEEAFALVQAAAECAFTCTTCADACLEEEDPRALRSCIRLNLDCADICTVTATLISRPGTQSPEVLRAQLEACIAACMACAEECASHAAHMEHCRVCAEACRACAAACVEMKGALVA
ncbi:MAG: four-helix bundle copper-binding protein [Gemmatimonadales bacterium]|nr:MAG: four-helix bundle copper-binding protein [Gemmatimonadales bacterium]